MPIHKPVLEALRGGPVRRNLFGAVDHEQVKNDHEDLLQGDLRDKACCWGFDFVGGVPLENGAFQWEALPEAEVPALYRPSVVCRGAARKPGPGDGAPSDFEGTSRAKKCSIAAQSLEAMAGTKQRGAVKRRQTNITDYYQAKRRAVKTPRKSGQ